MTDQEVTSFIRTTFRSVWSLELLLLLKLHKDRGWSGAQMVDALRGSELIVSQSVESLLAAGLIVVEPDGAVRYGPATASLAALVGGAETLYGRSPDAVRRAIIAGSSAGLSAFADSFRLRKD